MEAVTEALDFRVDTDDAEFLRVGARMLPVSLDSAPGKVSAASSVSGASGGCHAWYPGKP
jgi:hypothetical protein